MKSVVALILAFVAGASTAGTDRQAARQARVDQSGTGRISGVVVDAGGRLVPRALVRLTAAEIPSGRAAITDDKGAFAFEQLPAGRFSLSSSKPAYLAAAYGALRPGGTGTPIVLASGEKLNDVKLTMPRGGAVAGVIRDGNGVPIPSIQVSVTRVGAAPAGPARPLTSATTDERGAYRVFGLAPGQYLVFADLTTSAGLGEVGIMSTAEVDVAIARLQSRSAASGSTPPAEPERSPTSIVRPTRTFNPAPVFFPGVSSSAAATPITLGLGEVREGVDFVYAMVRTAAVTGTVSGAGDQSVQLSLAPEGGAFQIGTGFGSGPMLQRRAGAGDGEFTFTSVTPGKYTLSARTVAITARGIPAAPTGPRLFATTTIDVLGDDVRGVALVLQTMARVSGRVIFQGASQPVPAALTSLAVRVMPAGLTDAAAAVPIPPGMPAPVVAVIRADGSFLIEGVPPGRYRFATLRDLPGWRPKSAMLGGKDVFDTHFDVGSGEVTGIEVTMTDLRSQLAGQLLQANNSPATGYFVIAFPVDRALWPQSRRVRSIRPGTDGGFRFDDLPAGEYYLAALTDADSSDWQAPQFLELVIPAAIKFVMADGERKTQDIRIGR